MRIRLADCSVGWVVASPTAEDQRSFLDRLCAAGCIVRDLFDQLRVNSVFLYVVHLNSLICNRQLGISKITYTLEIGKLHVTTNNIVSYFQRLVLGSIDADLCK